LFLPPCVTRIEEVQRITPLLYMNGLSAKEGEEVVSEAFRQGGLNHQNVI